MIKGMGKSTYIALLDRFIRGETSTEEEQQLLIWFRSEDTRAKILDFYKKRWLEAQDNAEIEIELQERMYKQIKVRMQAITPKEKTPTKSVGISLSSWIRYAAVVLLMIAIGFGTHFYTGYSTKLVGEYIIQADKGQRASIVLPDGTKVWLNSHSFLSYSADYGVKERLVSLIGEAFFEVAKDEEHRFLVNADGLQVEALGTSFNVKAYNEDRTITTTLFTGKVKVNTPVDNIYLSEGEQAVLNKVNGQLKSGNPESLEYAEMWRNNELAFEGETLREIAVILNRMYNVTILFESDTIKNYRFSGVIRNNSLDNVIEIISLTAPIEYRTEGDTIIVSDKR